MDLLPDIERSFGLRLTQADIGHIRTFGDLHALIVDKTPGESGAACATMLVFHQLRQALARYGVDRRAGPALVLRDQGLPSPERLRSELANATGLEFPARVAGGWCLLALALLIALPVMAWAMGQPWLALATPPICWLVGRLDKGSWSAEWATLGSLARATAALNHAELRRQGARHSPAAVWNTLRTLVSGYGIGSRDVAIKTRLGA